MKSNTFSQFLWKRARKYFFIDFYSLKIIIQLVVEGSNSNLLAMVMLSQKNK